MPSEIAIEPASGGDQKASTAAENSEMEMITTAQQVQIISSSDGEEVEVDNAINEEILSVLSDSGNSVQSGFAGFSPLPEMQEYDSCIDYTQQPSVECLYHMAAGDNGRREFDTSFETVAARDTVTTFNLSTSHEHIVEINSNSTTKTQKEKRRQMQFGMDASNQKATNSTNTNNNNNNNKCSTESSSEFPVSSPSNPQATAGRYNKRPPLLKNTLPADAFERNLALITARNPQMSLDEKMAAWQCDTELSDVEDVNSFDLRFKEYEVEKTQGYQAMRHTKATDKPTTSSAAASAFIANQRRLKTALAAGKEHDVKKRSPSTASSTEHGDACCYTNTKKKTPQLTNQAVKLVVYDRVLGTNSSNKEGNASPIANAADLQSSVKSPRRRNYEEDFFKLHRLNREIDKAGNSEVASGGLIQMRLDFSKEKQELHLKEKANELFKTPNIPQKYLLLPKQRYNINHQMHTIQAAKTSPTSGMDSEDGSSIGGMVSGAMTEETGQLDDLKSNESNELIGAYAYHQQHEFCNYLGLTGMSTANAVANAVAELARCNPARRSLRVQRLQQQEKKKERHTKESQKTQIASAQLAQRRERGGRDMETDDNSSDEQNINSPALPSSPLPQPNNIDKQQPEIKILCQISANSSHSQAEMARRNCAKHLVAPLRQSLLQQLRVETKTEPRAPSNGTSTCPRSSQHSGECDDDEDDADGDDEAADGSSSSPTTPQPRRTAPAVPVRDNNCYNPHSLYQPQEPLEEDDDEEQSREQLQMLHDKFQKYLEASRKAKPSIFIVKCLNSIQSTEPAKQSIDMKPVAVQPTCNINEQLNTNSKLIPPQRKTSNSMLAPQQIGKALSLSSQTLRAMPTPPQTPKETFASSPQAQASKATTTPPQTPKTTQKMLLNLKPKIATSKRLTKGSNSFVSSTVRPFPLHRLLTRSAFNLSAQHQLRSRKIFIVKPPRVTIKAKSKPSESLSKHIVNKSSSDKWMKQSSSYKRTADDDNEMKSTISTPTKKRRASTPTATKRIAFTLKSPDATPGTAATVDNDAVVVSSTTNSCYDERMLKWNGQVPLQQQTLQNDTIATNDTSAGVFRPTINVAVKELYHNSSFSVGQSSRDHNLISTRNSSTQCNTLGISTTPLSHNTVPPEAATTTNVQQPLRFFNTSRTATQQQNPLRAENGRVLYIYYELDVLIVVQETLISFWKYSKLLQLLSLAANNTAAETISNPTSKTSTGHWSFTSARQKESSPALTEWLHLGECTHLLNDIEIPTPYTNRICIHNSMPIYVELRCRELPHERRDCNMLSMYINVYYYHDEEMVAKMHSVALDSVQSLPANVIYTTITESRYFVVSWPQENILGKVRSGMCKYSLTPQLDTLASIREFKSMRYEINYLECINDDKLLGFGETQLTIWDHRSGDVLMSYDLALPLGRNLGCHYFPSLEIGQNNVLLLFQYIKQADHQLAELVLIACSISHVTPTHRVLQRQALPSPAFNNIRTAINTGEHLLLTAMNDEELWLSCSDPSLWTCVAPQHTQRFYARGRSQLVEVTPKTLNVDSFANHVLKLAAKAFFNGGPATTAV